MQSRYALNKIKQNGLFRSVLPLEESGAIFTSGSKKYINFSSNDYLNLSSDKRMKDAAIETIKKWGCSSSGSRLMAGTFKIHETLEKRLADLFGYEKALVFGSGFLTNIGVINSLITKKDMIFFDKASHASLIDGIKLSGAKWKRFNHNDTDKLDRLLQDTKDIKGNIFIITDSVFSMDGDIAPIKQIELIAKKHNALLIVDEAHAIGIFGPKGGGISAESQIKPDIITGTLSKGLGSYGGFVICSAHIRNWIINTCRSFIFSTALPPMCAGSALKAIDIIEEEETLGTQLLNNAKCFHNTLCNSGFKMLPFYSQIIPIILGDNDKTVALSTRLWEEGILAKAIRPPTVSPNTSRIRISITLGHSQEDLDKAAQIIIKSSKNLGII